MDFFTRRDLALAVETMLTYETNRPKLLGILSGIKRRARARAVVAFAHDFRPPPPDQSMTTMQHVLLDVFGRAVGHGSLQHEFATPGRKADDRVDQAQLDAWLAAHRERFQIEGGRLLGQLNQEWRVLTKEAWHRAEQLRSDEAR
jgi:hypothetical protein